MPTPYFYPDHLHSERLYTRFLTADDATAWADFFRSSEAVAFFPPSYLSTPEASAQRWIDRQLTRYTDQRYGLQALIHKETQAFVGQCGLLRQEVDGVEELEVGYHIFRPYWGNGYAPEAARLFMDFAATHQLADAIISIIDIRNHNSQRVAEKNGLLRDKQTRWSDLDVYIYRKKLRD